MKYISNFLNTLQQSELLEQIYKEKWCLDLSRRTQHYGYKYDYKLRSINEKHKTQPFPEWLKLLAFEVGHSVHHVLKCDWPKFDQCIINEYIEGQSIAPHIDCTPCFEDIICTISLCSEYTMNLMNWKTKEKKNIQLEVGSLLILSGDSRYNWTHGLKPQKGNRVSITFRKVIL